MIQLLRAIERHHQRFKRPPIGPIGAHLVSNGANVIVCMFICISCTNVFSYVLCMDTFFGLILYGICKYSLC